MHRLRFCVEPIEFAGSVSSGPWTRAFLSTEETLTAEQTAALERYRARWAALKRSTASADRSAAAEGVQLAYQAAGLKHPARLVWCGSPVALSHLASRASRGDG